MDNFFSNNSYCHNLDKKEKQVSTDSLLQKCQEVNLIAYNRLLHSCNQIEVDSKTVFESFDDKIQDLEKLIKLMLKQTGTQSESAKKINQLLNQLESIHGQLNHSLQL